MATNISLNKKIKRLFVVLSMLLFYPYKVNAFLNFCFPISYTVLVFILGWPHMILDSFGYQLFSELLDISFITVGTVGNTVLFFIFGIAVDVWRRKKDSLPKKYWLKSPIIFLIFVAILLGLSFIDPTCWE
ncbi:MAG: hypothetical protein G01um101430_94 [Parcubacteria group bacterium Gr01-1014_30]|nr:MAG: hypothetical protein G01um101430_94 [Parcubacteria group bacterium Gr01-1014_30]